MASRAMTLILVLLPLTHSLVPSQQTDDGSPGTGGRVEPTQSRRSLPQGHVAAPRLDVDLQGEPDDWLAPHRRRPPGVETGREREDDAKAATTAAVRGNLYNNSS